MDPILDATQYDILTYVKNPRMLVQYLYVVNNPLIFVDPLGLMTIKYEDILVRREQRVKELKLQAKYDRALLGVNLEQRAAQEITHPYAEELKRLQVMLNYLGYSNIPEKDMGIDYGGTTAAAVKLFELNYGMTVTESTTSSTYLAVANAYVNKRYASSRENVRLAYYNSYKRLLSNKENIRINYYRKFDCKMTQGIRKSVLDSLPEGVTTKSIDGIIYFDYTSAMNTLMQEKEKIVLKHRIPSLEEYIEETNKSLSEVGQLTYDHITAYQAVVARELMWFKSMVEPYAEWDIKVKDNWEAIFGKSSFYGNQFRFVYEGTVITPEIMGNITYGYWGKALGASDELLYFGGGVANAGLQFWKVLSEYYGESKEDHDSVKRGIDYYNETH